MAKIVNDDGYTYTGSEILPTPGIIAAAQNVAPVIPAMSGRQPLSAVTLATQATVPTDAAAAQQMPQTPQMPVTPTIPVMEAKRESGYPLPPAVAPVAAYVPPPAATYSPTMLAAPSTWNVTADQTVQGQMAKMIDPNNPYYQQWATAGAKDAAARGFTGNDSIRQTGILDSVMRNATPIATSDASTYAKASGYNTDISNQFAVNNQNAANTAGQFNAAQTNSLTQALIGADTSRYGIDSSAATSRYGTDVGATTSKYNTDVNAATSIANTAANNDTSRYNADVGASTSRYGTDVNAATSLTNTAANNATSVANTTANNATSTSNTAANNATSTANTAATIAGNAANTIANNDTSIRLQAARDQNALVLQTNTEAANLLANYANDLKNVDLQPGMDAASKIAAKDNLTRQFQPAMDRLRPPTAAELASRAGMTTGSTNAAAESASSAALAPIVAAANNSYAPVVDVSQFLNFDKAGN